MSARKTPQQQCDYTIRRPGERPDGTPIFLDGHGDGGRTCGKFGRPVPHTYWIKRPGTTAQYDQQEGSTIRCPEHEDKP